MSRQIGADEYYGIHGEPLHGYGRYTDDDYVQWRIETDGNGRTVPICEGYVGPSAFDLNGERRAYARLEREAAEARKRHPDARAAIVELLAERPRTTRELSWKIGRANQSVREMLGDLHAEGLVEWEYTSDPGTPTTEHLWSLVSADLPQSLT